MRNRVLATSAVLGALLLASCGTSTAPGSAYSGSTATAMSSVASAASSAASSKAMPSAGLAVRKTRIGYVLTDELGYTVYWFAKDPRGSSHPACAGQCVLTWFPVTGRAVAAKGVTLDAKLGCITRANGVMQATYNGYPLYTFASDRAPGMTSGNGSDGVWHVIKEQVPGSSSSGW
jgi:predicted lipoprotein with Yx(FWY)xxD motif